MTSEPFIKPDYDAIVVGARCAGASTAMLLARQGARVLLVDWAEPGTDTMSTHALMRGAVMQLDRWGVLAGLRAAGTPAVRKTTFHYGDQDVPLELKPAFGTDALYAPRRHLLDATLVEAARAAGADVRFGTAFRDMTRDATGRVSGATLVLGGREVAVRAGVVVGADGRKSTVARKIGAPVRVEARASMGCVYGYFPAMQADGYRWYYELGTTAGAIPTNGGMHCVFAGAAPDELRARVSAYGAEATLKTLARRANSGLGAEIADLVPAVQPVVFSGERGFIRRSAGPGWALVGDAGYFKDPITAHGITDALRDAEILARSIARGSDAALSDYEATRDWLARDLFEVTDTIAFGRWTLAELQEHHVALNRAMKREQAWMHEAFAVPRLVA